MPEDYVLRLIRQIATALAGIMTKQKGGNLIEAREELQTATISTIGISLEKLKQLSPESVSELVANTGASHHLRAVTLAELLLLDTELNPTGDETAQPTPNDVHAFCLLADSMSALNREEQAIYEPKLNRLANKMSALKNHPYIQKRLRDWGTGGDQKTPAK